jgi:hypothetical protein
MLSSLQTFYLGSLFDFSSALSFLTELQWLNSVQMKTGPGWNANFSIVLQTIEASTVSHSEVRFTL